MQRRQLLQLLAVSGVSAAVGAGTSTLIGAIASEKGSHWGYVGETGPDHWGNLSPQYQACRAGMQQSPINLTDAVKADLSAIAIRYQSIPLTILNNGHTIQVDAIAGNSIQIDGDTFELKQFHFHHPSEHTVNGTAFPMEVHFVHANAKNELAVLGIFLTEGAENSMWRPIWAAMPEQPATAKTIPGTSIDLAQLLPRDRAMFRYFGSLTTPPCSEVVKWVVFQEAIAVSAAQIAQFKAIFPMNARPVQSLNRRFLLRSQ